MSQFYFLSTKTFKARNIHSYWLYQTSPGEESNWSDLCHLLILEPICVVGCGLEFWLTRLGFKPMPVWVVEEVSYRLSGPCKLGKGCLQRKRLARQISVVIYYTEPLGFRSPCPLLLLFFSRGLLSLSVFLTCNTVYSTVVFCSAFNDYLIRMKRPLNLSPVCKFKW